MSERLIVIGGGAGGPSAAAKAKREHPGLDVVMFEAGQHVSYAACPTPYFIADWIREPERLIARTPEKFAAAGIELFLETAVIAIDTDARSVASADGRSWTYDHLVYATGAVSQRPARPGFDRPEVFTLKNLADAIRIKAFLDEHRPRRAVILGAGFIALEMAEAFRERGLRTTMLYRGELPMRRLARAHGETLREELARHEVEFVSGTEVEGIEAGNAGLEVVSSGGRFGADLVLLALGVRPEVRLAQAAGIALGETGAVGVDEGQRTNLEAIYAAGDCAEAYHRIARRPVHLPLGDIANRQGRIAGARIAGQPARFPGVLGSQCFKLFDLEVAATGLTEEEARAAGYDPIAALVTARSRAHSYPDGAPLQLTLVAERASGRLLGAQLVGREGAVGRANAVAAALHREATLEDLAYLDLCYAPPFSGVWDPLQIAAQQCLKAR